MNIITQKEKQEFRAYFEKLKSPKTVAAMAEDWKTSPNFIRRRLQALGRNVVQKLPPEKGVPGRPAARYQVRP